MITTLVTSVALGTMNMCCLFAMAVIFTAVMCIVMQNCIIRFLREIGFAFIAEITRDIELSKQWKARKNRLKKLSLRGHVQEIAII